jgi:hypothetical protein
MTAAEATLTPVFATLVGALNRNCGTQHLSDLGMHATPLLRRRRLPRPGHTLSPAAALGLAAGLMIPGVACAEPTTCFAPVVSVSNPGKVGQGDLSPNVLFDDAPLTATSVG